VLEVDLILNDYTAPFGCTESTSSQRLATGSRNERKRKVFLYIGDGTCTQNSALVKSGKDQVIS